MKNQYTDCMITAQIQDKELSEYLQALPEDDMIHFTLAHGRLRGAIFAGTHFVNQMQAQHKTGILETYILGQASLCGALLIPAIMKGREHLTWHYDATDFPAKGFNIEADSSGWVRGYLLTDHISIDKPLENWDLKPFLGDGCVMTVQTLHPQDKFPQTTAINTTGNIADDLVFYFNRSYQIQTALTTSIQMDKQGRVIGAGGIFLQVMPSTGGTYNGKKKLGSQIDTGANQEEDEELIAKVESVYKTTPSLGTWFSRGRSAEDLINQLFEHFSPVIALHRSVIWNCPCTKESFLNHIKALPKNDLDDIKSKKDAIEITCHNCGSVYKIFPDEIKD